MRRVNIYQKIVCISALFLSVEINAQLSQQGYSTGVTGGKSSSTNYASEVSSGNVGGKPASESYSILTGLAAANLESAVISVNAVNSSSATVSESSTGYLLKVKASGRYDTLDVTISSSGGSFAFPAVFHGDYLVAIESDPTKYVATYYTDALLWDDADVLELSMDTLAQVSMIETPPDRNESTGAGKVSGTITEDFTDDEGRIDARRRAAKRKCGLRRKRSGGRIGQNNDEFELIAYGETNDNGEFEYGFLPQGTYRFFVEYPGIPLDESSFVEFEIGEAGVSDSEFVLAAVVTEEGISVELVLGITTDFFTDFSIYPNPTTDIINVGYDKILSNDMSMELIDMNGNILITKKLDKQENGSTQVSVGKYAKGQYLLRFTDHQQGKTALTFRIMKK